MDRRQLLKEAETLREMLKAADALSTTRRATMDNQARARDYAGLAQTAATLATEAKAAQAAAARLDQAMTTLNAKPT